MGMQNFLDSVFRYISIKLLRLSLPCRVGVCGEIEVTKIGKNSLADKKSGPIRFGPCIHWGFLLRRMKSLAAAKPAFKLHVSLLLRCHDALEYAGSSLSPYNKYSLEAR